MGALTLGFSREALVDIEGSDLFIFEIGPGVEAMMVDISADGKTWVSVGEAPGGRAQLTFTIPSNRGVEGFRIVAHS